MVFTRSNFQWKGSHASKSILLDYSNIWMEKEKKISPLPRCLFFVMPSRWIFEYLGYGKHNSSISGAIKWFFSFHFRLRYLKTIPLSTKVALGFRVDLSGMPGHHMVATPCGFAYLSHREFEITLGCRKGYTTWGKGWEKKAERERRSHLN